MPISPTVLDIISGKAMVDTSTQLLDNTLATINMKMKKKEQQQMSQLRSQQIQQASMELAELEKGAYNRKLERDMLERRNLRALETLDQTMDREDQVATDAAAKTHFEGMQARFNTVINSGNNAEYQAMLDKVGPEMPQDRYEELKAVNWDNPAERKEVLDNGILDIDFLQRMALEEAKAGASGSGGTQRRGIYNIENLKEGLSNTVGLKPDETPMVSQAIVDVSHDYADANVDVKVSDVEAVAKMLLSQDRDKYAKRKGGVLGMWSDADVNIPLLKSDIKMVIEYGVTTDVYQGLLEDNPGKEAQIQQELRRRMGR